MTGWIHVSVDCGLMPGGLAGEPVTYLVGNIFAVPPATASLREVTLPVGDSPKPASFEVRPGRYVVEVGLPSGHVLSEDAVVANNDEATVAFDLRDASPYGSHTLQYLLGNVEPSAAYHSNDEYPATNSRSARPAVVTGRTPFESTRAGQAEADILVLDDDRPLAIDALNRLREQSPADASDAVATLLRVPDPPEPVRAGAPADLSPIYEVDEWVHSAMPGALSNRRVYLRLTAGDKSFLATVPTWESSAVEILLNLRAGPTGSPVSVAVRSLSWGAALGYLSSGSLHKAAALFPAEASMRPEHMDPLVVAASGYVLVGTRSDDRWEPWGPWLGNLRTGFPTVSDGAVLWGVHRLQTSRTAEDLDDAREALLEGYRRGLPVYTLGLAWLMDGLSSFPDDPGCAEAFQQVRQLCWQVDMSQPFVVLRLGRQG